MSVIYNAKVLPQVKDEEPKSKILVNFGLLSGKEVFEVELSEQATVVELRDKVVSQLGYTKGSPFEEFQPAFDWKHKDGTELHGHEIVSQLEEFFVEEKRQEMVSAVVSHWGPLQHHGSDSCKLDKVPSHRCSWDAYVSWSSKAETCKKKCSHDLFMMDDRSVIGRSFGENQVYI